MSDDSESLAEDLSTLRWARRSSDVHAGLAAERLQDLVERLRRLAAALSARGDDLTAGLVDDHVDRLRGLRDVLVTLESSTHEQRRTESEPRVSLSPQETERRLNLTSRLNGQQERIHVHAGGSVVRHSATATCADCAQGPRPDVSSEAREVPPPRRQDEGRYSC